MYSYCSIIFIVYRCGVMRGFMIHKTVMRLVPILSVQFSGEFDVPVFLKISNREVLI